MQQYIWAWRIYRIVIAQGIQRREELTARLLLSPRLKIPTNIIR
jgi:hypothetical protein